MLSGAGGGRQQRRACWAGEGASATGGGEGPPPLPGSAVTRLTRPHPPTLGSGASTNFLWKTHRGGLQTPPASPGGMVRRLGPPSCSLAQSSSQALPTARSAQGPLREGSPAHHSTRGISSVPLPLRQEPWGSFLLLHPTLPHSQIRSLCSSGGWGSSFLPPVWRRNSHPRQPPGAPRWEVLMSDYKGASSPAIPARACNRHSMRGVRASRPHASLSSQFGSPPAFALGTGRCRLLQKEEICDQPVGQDAGCGQPPEGNFLGPLESEASKSGKANILGFCLSSCVQAEAQALARKSR